MAAVLIVWLRTAAEQRKAIAGRMLAQTVQNGRVVPAPKPPTNHRQAHPGFVRHAIHGLMTSEDDVVIALLADDLLLRQAMLAADFGENDAPRCQRN